MSLSKVWPPTHQIPTHALQFMQHDRKWATYCSKTVQIGCNSKCDLKFTHSSTWKQWTIHIVKCIDQTVSALWCILLCKFPQCTLSNMTPHAEQNKTEAEEEEERNDNKNGKPIEFLFPHLHLQTIASFVFRGKYVSKLLVASTVCCRFFHTVYIRTIRMTLTVFVNRSLAFAVAHVCFSAIFVDVDAAFRTVQQV